MDGFCACQARNAHNFYASVTVQGFLEALLDINLIFNYRTALSVRNVFSRMKLAFAWNLPCLNLISGHLLDLIYDLDAKFMDLRTKLS